MEIINIFPVNMKFCIIPKSRNRSTACSTSTGSAPAGPSGGGEAAAAAAAIGGEPRRRSHHWGRGGGTAAGPNAQPLGGRRGHEPPGRKQATAPICPFRMRGDRHWDRHSALNTLRHRPKCGQCVMATLPKAAQYVGNVPSLQQVNKNVLIDDKNSFNGFALP